MTSHSKAFGRSLPRDMQEERAHALMMAGQAQVLRPVQKWKVSDATAQKTGNCQAVYWVKEKPPTTELKRHNKPDEKKWDTGAVYKGEWQGNKKHGYGIQIWSNGNKYEGEWANGNREGHGVFWLKEKVVASKTEEEKSSSSSSSSAAKPAGATPARKLRRVYAGNWKNDLKDGVGVHFYADGSRYEGSWSEGVRCGRGTLYSINGDQYTGEWRGDTQNGFGTLTKANKDVYEGMFLAGLREGAGIYYYKSQEKIYDGEWVNDAPKCGVYTDAKEFFDDDAEEARYAAASGEVRLGRDGKPLSSSANGGGQEDEEDDQARLAAAAQSGSAGDISARVPRNFPRRGGGGAAGGGGAGVPVPMIPRLRMEDADSVLATAIESVALSRAAVRNLPHVALSDLFNTGSLDALRRLFAAYDHDADSGGDGSGRLPLANLHPMLGELGLPPLAPHTFEQLCTDLRKSSHKERMGFKDFVRAVHLMEEDRNIKQAQQQDSQQEEDE